MIAPKGCLFNSILMQNQSQNTYIVVYGKVKPPFVRGNGITQFVLSMIHLNLSSRSQQLWVTF